MDSPTGGAFISTEVRASVAETVEELTLTSHYACQTRCIIPQCPQGPYATEMSPALQLLDGSRLTEAKSLG